MENRPAQEFIDHQMSSNVESVMLAEFSKIYGRNPGRGEFASYIENMPAQELASIVRSSPAVRGITVLLRRDSDIARWATQLVAKYR